MAVCILYLSMEINLKISIADKEKVLIDKLNFIDKEQSTKST